MKIFRLIGGVSLLLSSSWLSVIVARIIGVDDVYGVAVGSLLVFFAGMWFYSGVKN